MSENEMPEELEAELPDEIIDEILDSGLIVVAGKQHGKSTAVKHIVRQTMKRMDIRNFILDTCQNWRHEFDSIPYIELNDLTTSMPDTKNMLFDVRLFDPKDIRTATAQFLSQVYSIQFELKAELGGKDKLPYWNLFVIEEIHNQLGSYALNGREGRFTLKVWSEGSNYKISFIGITQRLADVSTKVTERAMGYLFGKLNGDNDKRKAKRIIGKALVDKLEKLKRGEFIYWNGEKAYFIRFPKFKPNGKPYPYEKDKKGFMIKEIFLK